MTATDGKREDPAATPARPIVPGEAILKWYLEPVQNLTDCDLLVLSEAYRKARSEAEGAGEVDRGSTLGLLEGLCGILLRSSGPGDDWVPMASGPGGRSALPPDFAGAQCAEFSSVLDRVEHPAVRARLANIIWTNHIRDGDAARAAVDAYCECAEALVSGRFGSGLRNDAVFEAITAVDRALKIANGTTKKSDRPARLLRGFEAVYAAAKERQAFSAFVEAAELALHYQLVARAEIATDAEALASAAPSGVYPMAVQAAWDLAARLNHGLQNSQAKDRCLIGSVEQSLAMRGQVNGAAAEAAWVMKALQTLRHVDGMDEKKNELEIELGRLQKASVREMGTFWAPLDVEPDRERISEQFAKLDLADALFQFAILATSPTPEYLREQARAMSKAAPLTAMMSVSFTDSDGRVTARSAGAPMEGEPEEFLVPEDGRPI